MIELRGHYPYRLTYNMDRKELAGRVVIFYEIQIAGAYRRARVRLMNPDGGTDGQIDWYVWPNLLISV